MATEDIEPEVSETTERRPAVGQVEVVEPEGPVPDIYADSAWMVIGTYDVALQFSVHDFAPHTNTSHRRLVGRVRLSHAHAWILAKKLEGLLNERIKDVGPFYLPKAFVATQQLQEEYDAMHRRAFKGDE